jgi:hypothetical protein
MYKNLSILFSTYTQDFLMEVADKAAGVPLDTDEAAQLLLDLSNMNEQIPSPSSCTNALHLEEDLPTTTNEANNVSITTNLQIEERRAIISRAKKKSLFEYQNSKLRAQGKSYSGIQKAKGGAAKVVEKDAKAMGLKCPETSFCNTTKNTVFQCKILSEGQRAKIHSNFWEKNEWNWKKSYIKSLVTHHEPQKVVSESRENSFQYYLPLESGQRIRVCAKTFAATFSIPRSTILRWLRDDETISSRPKQAEKAPAQNEEEAATSKKKPQNQTECEDFLNRLPRLESHYCRQHDRRFYIERNWSSMRDFYRYDKKILKYASPF